MAYDVAIESSTPSDSRVRRAEIGPSVNLASELTQTNFRASQRTEATRYSDADARYLRNEYFPSVLHVFGTDNQRVSPPTYNVYERPSSQAVHPMPALGEVIKSNPYNSSIKLNVQITNVFEVSRPVMPQEILHYLDRALQTGAEELRPIENHLEQPNAVNQDLSYVGQSVYNLSKHYAHHPTDLVSDAKHAAKTTGEVARSLLDQISQPMPPDQRAIMAGSLLPIFMLNADASADVQIAFKSRKMEIIPAGAGGNWPVINERISNDVIRQLHPNACVSACGEMLTNGSVSQGKLIEEFAQYVPKEIRKPNMGANFWSLSTELGAPWVSRFARKNTEPQVLNNLLSTKNSWSAEMLSEGIGGSHAIVVDGMNEAGEIMIRDPWEGTRYEMTQRHFLEHWNGNYVCKQ